MKSPRSVIPLFPQKHKFSCTSWGIDLLLQLFEKLDSTKTPFQDAHPHGCGFEAAVQQQLLADHNLACRDKDYGTGFAAFEADVRAELAAGRFPIVSFPEFVWYNPDRHAIRLVNHVWVATAETGSLTFVTSDCVRMQELSRDDFQHRHQKWAEYLGVLKTGMPTLLHVMFSEPSS